MKWLISTLLVLLIIGSKLSINPSVITFSNHGYNPGDSLHYIEISLADSIFTMEDVEDETWDFSFIKLDNKTDILVIVEKIPAGHRLSNIANLVTHTLKNGIQSDTYYYQNKHSLKIVGLGRQTQDGTYISEYYNSLLEIDFPFRKGDEFEDNYAYSINFNESGELLTIWVEGIVKTKADATGLLKTTAFTHENVIRTKSIVTENIKTYLDDKLVNSSSTTSMVYQWYDAGMRYCLLELCQDSKGNITVKILVK